MGTGAAHKLRTGEEETTGGSTETGGGIDGGQDRWRQS